MSEAESIREVIDQAIDRSQRLQNTFVHEDPYSITMLMMMMIESKIAKILI